MIETQYISYHTAFISNNRYIHTFESNESMKQGNKYFYFIINSFIFTIRHQSSLFVTIRHQSSLVVTIRHYSSLFVAIRDYLHYLVTIRHYSRLFALFGLYCKYSSVFAELRVKNGSINGPKNSLMKLCQGILKSIFQGGHVYFETEIEQY